jgi:hypothetical protein
VAHGRAEARSLARPVGAEQVGKSPFHEG